MGSQVREKIFGLFMRVRVSAAKDAGHLRTEGKDYEVQGG